MHKNVYVFGEVEFAESYLSFCNGIMNFCFQTEVSVDLTKHPWRQNLWNL